MVRLTEEEWRWLIGRPLAAHPRKIEVMLLRYVHRCSVETIAAALDITVNNVRVVISASWTILTLWPWEEADREYVCELIRRGEGQDADPEGPLTDHQHARALLAAMRLPVPSPATPVFDERGRQVGGRSPLVSVDELVEHIQAERAQRARETQAGEGQETELTGTRKPAN